MIQAIAGRARVMLLYAEDYPSYLQELSAVCFGLFSYDSWGPHNSVTSSPSNVTFFVAFPPRLGGIQGISLRIHQEWI